MKKFSFISVVAVAAVVFLGCKKNNGSYDIPPIDNETFRINRCGQEVECNRNIDFGNNEYLTMSISPKAVPLADGKFTLTYNNQTSRDFVYGNPFMLYYFENNKWNFVEFKENIGFSLIGYVLKAFSEGNQQGNVIWCFDNLKRGVYRYVTDISPSSFGGSEITYFLYDEFILK